MTLARIACILPLLLAAFSCNGDEATQDAEAEVGTPCVPSLESDPSFSGFSLYGASVEPRGCERSACLVNHFQGRVSCAYGQTAEQVELLDAQSPERCRLPGSDEPVEVPVEPQRIYRNARDQVYCSCRCKGPDPDARYCDCPSGYECAPLIEEYGLPLEAEVAGSYCVKAGTAYNPQQVIPSEVCRAEDARRGGFTADRRYSIAEVCGINGANP